MKLARARYWLVGSLFLVGACAHMEPPSGGPEDKTPPFLTGVFPNPGSVSVPTDLNVVLEFSEWIAAAWVKNAVITQITLSPALPRKLKFTVTGKRIQITSPSPLQPATTYILMVHKTLTDLQNQPLKEGFQLTFSTGPELAEGQLAGKLLLPEGKSRPTFIGLYPLGEIRKTLPHLHTPYIDIQDTLPHPTRERPEYLLATDSTGQFATQGIRPGRYAVLAFEDSEPDLKPNPAGEKLAIGPLMNIGTEPLAPLRVESYTPPLLGITAANFQVQVIDSTGNLMEGVLEVAFSEPVAWSDSTARPGLMVEGADSTASLQIRGIHYPGQSLENKVRFWLGDLAKGGSYQARLVAPENYTGTPLDTAAAHKYWRAEGKPDSAQSKLVLNYPAPKDTQAVVSGPIELLSNRPLSSQDAEYLKEALYFVVENDTLEAQVKPGDFLRLYLNLPMNAHQGQKIQLWQRPPQAPPDTVAGPPADSAGTPSPDSTRTQPLPWKLGEFTLSQQEDWGAVDFKQAGKFEPWVVHLKTLKGKVLREVPLFRKAVGKCDSLPPGKYLVNYFTDNNSNGRWDKGGFDPWQSQESYFAGPDTLVIRPQETASYPLVTGAAP